MPSPGPAEAELFGSDPVLANIHRGGLALFGDDGGAVFAGERTQTEYALPGTRIGKPIGTRTVDDVRSTGEAELDIFRSPGEIERLHGTDLQSLQVDLFAGGFFGRGADPDEIRWGDPADEATQQAWGRAVNVASRYYAAGQKLTVTEVLALARQRGGAGGADGAARPVALGDPAGISATFDDVARSVVGRKASDDERRMFVRLIHAAQRSQQAALAAGGEGLGVDVEAQAEALLRQQNPLEAEGHDFAATMATFTELISQMGQS